MQVKTYLPEESMPPKKIYLQITFVVKYTGEEGGPLENKKYKPQKMIGTEATHAPITPKYLINNTFAITLTMADINDEYVTTFL